MTTEKIFNPSFETWRHGGWYVTNVHYPSGAVGCISANYADKHWRIVCAEFNEATFSSRRDAATGEYVMVETIKRERKTFAPFVELVREVVSDWPQFDADQSDQEACDVNGGDLVEYIGEWRRRVVRALAKIDGKAVAS